MDCEAVCRYYAKNKTVQRQPGFRGGNKNTQSLLEAKNYDREFPSILESFATRYLQRFQVYDTEFLVNTHRPFAMWELAREVALPPGPENQKPAAGHEETVAQTVDQNGNVLGSWVVRWSENGEGTCHAVGKVQR
jgi:hypothetical protein